MSVFWAFFCSAFDSALTPVAILRLAITTSGVVTATVLPGDLFASISAAVAGA